MINGNAFLTDLIRQLIFAFSLFILRDVFLKAFVLRRLAAAVWLYFMSLHRMESFNCPVDM